MLRFVIPTTPTANWQGRNPPHARRFSFSAVVRLSITLGLLFLPTFSRPVWGGLTASDVVVVVNRDSLNSRTLANHYVALRQIPAANVIVLGDIPASEVIGVEEFRTKILRPLLSEIERRGLLHVQCVSYSADFPSAIDISADLSEIENLHQVFTPRASINALTYLYSRVLSEEPTYIDLNINYYARRQLDTYFSNPAGKLSQADWDAAQALVTAEQHAEASLAFEEIYKQQPHQFPLAYLTAAEAAQAGDNPRALKWLNTAISKGWNAARYLAKDKRFDSLRDDSQFQVLELLLDEQIKELQPAVGFDSRTAWAPNGVPVQDLKFGYRYLLSTVLGVTRGGGTTLPQAITSLERAASADFTHPEGGFYFSLTSDVRTTTRKWGFLGAVDDLKAMGFEAEIIPDALPQNRPAVLGAQLGIANFDWNSANSQFVPGAVAENLTSLGGVMTSQGGQTKLTELIQAGAAGSSGAVIEPYALQEKFPHPQLYVHYARGASLAEAFYLSLTGPYQLLIVGDPLCRPFSHAPQPALDTSLRQLDNGQAIQLDIDLSGPQYLDWLELPEPAAQRKQPLAPMAVSVLFDGRNLQAGALKSKLNIQLVGQSPGYHEIILRFMADDPFSQRADTRLPVWIGPADGLQLSTPKIAAPPDNSAQPASLRPASVGAGPLTVHFEAQQAERVSLWHDAEQIAVANGSSGDFRIPLESRGMGPVRLHAQAELADGSTLQSLPLWIDIQP